MLTEKLTKYVYCENGMLTLCVNATERDFNPFTMGNRTVVADLNVLHTKSEETQQGYLEEMFPYYWCQWVDGEGCHHNRQS